MERKVALIFVLLLGLALFLLLKKQNAEKEKLPDSVSIATNTVVSIEGHAENDHAVILATTNDVEALFAQNLTDAATNAYMQNLLQRWQTRIDFYGKVVDEKGSPVEGASIQFNWTEVPSFEGPGNSATTTSDAAGLFSLEGKHGPSLNVRVMKDGYYTSPANRMGFSYRMGQVFLPDQTNPVVFRLRKKGQGVQLITSENGIRSNVAVRVSKNDVTIQVDLLEKKPSATGQLEIGQIKPPWREATNWSFRLSIPAGGFVENQDEFQFEAPESNYLPSVEYSFSKNETNWTTQVSKQFYIAFGQPRKFGWLRIESNLAQETVFLTYAINPTGARNLEPAN